MQSGFFARARWFWSTKYTKCQGEWFDVYGVKACNLGYTTKFYPVTELVLKLATARKNGTLERLLRDLRSLDLLILDEWGYVPIDKDGSQLLFRVISDSYESKSLILTTNLEFSKWGGIFTDVQMAAAMIDLLVHHGHLLILTAKATEWSMPSCAEIPN